MKFLYTVLYTIKSTYLMQVRESSISEHNVYWKEWVNRIVFTSTSFNASIYINSPHTVDRNKLIINYSNICPYTKLFHKFLVDYFSKGNTTVPYNS
jgi:hypothetical protein